MSTYGYRFTSAENLQLKKAILELKFGKTETATALLESLSVGIDAGGFQVKFEDGEPFLARESDLVGVGL